MAKPTKKRARPPRASRKAEESSAEVRERILRAFSAKARRSGIRAVLMGELASELRMSPMTLYKHFESKDDLVSATVEAWALDITAIGALEWDKAVDCQSALQVLLSWADAWAEILAEVSPAFFEDLQRDHPDEWRRYRNVINERKLVAARHLRPFLREDAHPSIVFRMLDMLVLQAASPRFVEQVGTSRREAMRQAISLWGGGALRERTQLHALPRPEGD
jgi:AcrR family transcriptional regulator